jgi:hypothetical protein
MNWIVESEASVSRARATRTSMTVTVTKTKHGNESDRPAPAGLQLYRPITRPCSQKYGSFQNIRIYIRIA